MSNLKKKILNKLQEGAVNERTVSPDELKKNTDDLVKTAKDALDIDDIQAKDYVSGFIGEDVNELNQEVMDKFIKQYGAEKGKQIYYATANKQGRNPEDFHTESDDVVSRGIEYEVNPEIEVDKYEEYRKLMQQLASEENQDGEMNEDSGNETNDPVKLKADVAKLMAKLDMAAIAPYLTRIDNPAEQAEVIAQFAEKIGVPKQKLAGVVSQLRTVAESKRPTMTKDKLIETVTGKKKPRVIKTVKVKDIK